jgi:hypothetical protein
LHDIFNRRCAADVKFVGADAFELFAYDQHELYAFQRMLRMLLMIYETIKTNYFLFLDPESSLYRLGL